MFIIADDGPVRTVTIDRPERRNAIPPQGWERLREIFVDFESSDRRVLVITGSGGAFCSGADLSSDSVSAAALQSAGGRYERMQVVGAAAEGLHRITKPTIAAVDGIAAGAGLSLALGCDIVIASTRASFSALFVRRGLTVDFGGTWLLPRLIGLQHAKELALSGRMVLADEARDLGMATRVVEPEELDAAVRAVADGFLAGGPLAQAMVKSAMNRSAGMSFEASLALEAYAQTICLGSEDAVEGISAFLQKRPPEFTGR